MLLGSYMISFMFQGFWSFLVKFTHKDVLSQLNHLGQITTEIGLCRVSITEIGIYI